MHPTRPFALCVAVAACIVLGPGPAGANRAGDVDANGSVNAVDLQLAINQALGTAAATPAADLDGDGSVTAVDVQALINVILGGAATPSASWVVKVDDVTGTDDRLWGLDVGSDGHVLLFGRRNGVGGGFSGASYVRKLNGMTGATIWTQPDPFDIGTATSNGNGIAMDPSDNAFVVASSPFRLSKIEPDGDRAWTVPLFRGATGVASDALGDAYVVGNDTAAFPNEAYVARYSPTGTQRWIKTFAGTNHTVGVIRADASGHCYFATTSRAVTKLDANGDEVWTSSIAPDGEAFGLDSSGEPVLLDGGDLVVLNAATGAERSRVSALPLPSSANGHTLALDGGDNVFVAGEVFNAHPGSVALGALDLVLQQYDCNGTLQWTKQIGTDQADGLDGFGGGAFSGGLRVGADGTPFFAGTTTGSIPGQTAHSGTFSDVFVVAYGGPAPSQPPAADAQVNLTMGSAPLTVTFDATGSTAPASGIATYAWDFGDGNSGTGATVQHTYQSAGTMSATLSVQMKDGETFRSAVGVQVGPMDPIDCVARNWENNVGGQSLFQLTKTTANGGTGKTTVPDASGICPPSYFEFTWEINGGTFTLVDYTYGVDCPNHPNQVIGPGPANGGSSPSTCSANSFTVFGDTYELSAAPDLVRQP